MKRVVVGLSGGVDSSVSAYLLQKQGYDVVGIFMKNWHDESVTLSDECPWIDDSNDALLVASQLGIPFQVLDLSEDYKERIINYMFDEYASGRTPNPDVLCNREIKFDVFLKSALELGADYVATGHYCRVDRDQDGTAHLLAGVDKNKDQSYFLCQLTQSQLKKTLFPIGEMQKKEVRELAKENDLVTAEKKDSQGLCFVGKISLPDFLQQQLEVKPGKIIEIPDTLSMFDDYHQTEATKENVISLAKPFVFTEQQGKAVGQHQGAHFYTIGQRKGLHIGGRPHPSFVIAIDTNENIVYTGQTDQHPGLNRRALKLDKKSLKTTLNSVNYMVGDEIDYDFRIRYRQPLQKGTLIVLKDGFYVLFKEKQRGITPGQFCAWYDGVELIGSAVIA